MTKYHEQKYPNTFTVFYWIYKMPEVFCISALEFVVGVVSHPFNTS